MIRISLQPSVVILLAMTTAAAIVAATTGRPGSLDGPLAALAEKIEDSRLDHKIPGMVVVVVKDGEIVFLRGFGVADLVSGAPVTAETVFAIGSATKAMTATLIGMMVDDGVMDWDDAVRAHLPEFTISDDGVAGQVTLRDLLSHRTGLGRTDLLWASGGADRETILDAVARAELRRPFRSSFQYNNVGFLAAGEAAGRAADSTWDALMQERLIKPLGMTSATLCITELDQNRVARGYDWREDCEAYRLRPMRNVTNCAPAGAVNATAVDMARWLRFQLSRGEIDGKRLISADVLEETWKPQIEIAPGIEYGLGWFVREWQGRTLIEHGGNIDGFASQIAFLPEENLGFAVMMNVSGSTLQRLIIPMIFSAFIETDDESEPVLHPDELESYVGEYEFAGFERPVKALVRDGRLALDVPGQTIYDLRPPGEDGRWRFAFDESIAVSFDRDADGYVIGLTLYQAGLELEMPRVGVERPAEVSRDDVEPYLGTYRFEVMQTEVEVLISNGRLAVDVPDQMVYELHSPDEDGRWRFRVTDQIAVRFDRDEDGTVTSMTLFQGPMEFELPKVAEAGAAVGIAVRDLLQRMREAYGTAHLDRLGAVRLTGSVDFLHQGILDADSVILLDGPIRFYEKIDMGVFGHIAQAVGDDVAWNSAFGEQPEILRGRYRDQMILMNPLLLATDWRETFDEVNYLRQEERDDRIEHVLQVRFGDDVHMTVYVDDESAYVVRQTLRLMLQGMGSFPVSLRLGDYRQVEGVAIPHRYEVDNEFAGLVIYQIENVEANAKIAPDAFDPPVTARETQWFKPLAQQ